MKYVKTFENFENATKAVTKDELKDIIEMGVEDSDFSIYNEIYIHEPSYYGDSDEELKRYEENKSFSVTIDEIFDNNSKISALYASYKADRTGGLNNYIYKIKNQNKTEDGYVVDPDQLDKNSQNLVDLIAEVEAINKKLFDNIARKYDFIYDTITVKSSLQSYSDENPIVKVTIRGIKFKAS